MDYIPSALPDESLDNPIGSAVTVDPLANDLGVFDPTTVMIIDPATGLAVTSLVVPGEGTWDVDPVTGAITFTPEPGFEGNPTIIDYTVDDIGGETVTSTVEVTYVPEAAPDTDLNNVPGTAVTVDPLANDSGVFDPTTVMILGPSGAPVTSLIVPGEGTWDVDPVTGAITFTPEPGFEGNPTIIDYTVDTIEGETVGSTVEVTYAPEAAPDESHGNAVGTPVTVDPLANDSGDFDPTTVMIIDPATGLPVASLVVPGEGTWDVDPVTGAITFTPEPGFLGDPTPIGYSVDDVSGNTVESTVTITYDDPIEAAPDESLGNVLGAAVTIDVLGNDPGLNIDPTTVMILDADGNPVTELVVPGEGTWSVDPVTGAITFTPEPGFQGDPTPVDYIASDVLGASIAPQSVTITYVDPVPSSAPPALAFTGVESLDILFAALLTLAAGMGLTLFARNLVVARKEEE